MGFLDSLKKFFSGGQPDEQAPEQSEGPAPQDDSAASSEKAPGEGEEKQETGM